MTAFRVTRTSQRTGSKDIPPCPEAYAGVYTAHSYCTLPLAKAMKAPQTDWFRRLTNHRSAPGGSVADQPEQTCWFVDLDTITDLQAFIDRHGTVVVDCPSDGPTIDIYDWYRE